MRRAVTLHLPPLRARTGDVRLLLDKMLERENARGGPRRIERVEPAALARLERHAWPGNVRELGAVIASAFATGEGATLGLEDLPREIASLPRSEPPSAPFDEPESGSDPDEAARIRRALESAGGDRERAANMLGVSRTTLWRRMRALGLLEPGSEA